MAGHGGAGDGWRHALGAVMVQFGINAVLPGFYGVIIDITEDMLIVEFGNNKNCRIPMRKDAVVEVEKPEN